MEQGKALRRLLTRSQTTPNLPERLGGSPFPPETPRSSGGDLQRRAFPSAWTGLVALALMVVVAASLGAASLVAVVESPAAAAVAVEAAEPKCCSAPLPPSSSGASVPALPRRRRHHAGASRTWTPPPGCFGRWLLPAPRLLSGLGWRLHSACGGARAPALSLFLSWRGPDLRG
jgi:hypothetical protein